MDDFAACKSSPLTGQGNFFQKQSDQTHLEDMRLLSNILPVCRLPFPKSTSPTRIEYLSRRKPVQSMGDGDNENHEWYSCRTLLSFGCLFESLIA